MNGIGCRGRRPGRSTSRQGSVRWRVWVLAVALAGSGGGCGELAWHYDYAQGLARGQAQNRPVFIYFRDWMNPQCAQMENQVLRQPESREALGSMTLVLLDVRLFEDVADRHGVSRTPAWVVVRPDDGRELGRYDGLMTQEAFVARLAAIGALGPKGPNDVGLSGSGPDEGVGASSGP